MYRIIDESDEVYAVDDDGKAICGATCPKGHTYWQLYVTRSVSELAGVRVPPHREHFWGDHGKADAIAWVEVIAALYSLAVERKSVAA